MIHDPIAGVLDRLDASFSWVLCHVTFKILNELDNLGPVLLTILLFVHEKCPSNKILWIKNWRVELFGLPILIKTGFDKFFTGGAILPSKQFSTKIRILAVTFSSTY